ARPVALVTDAACPAQGNTEGGRIRIDDPDVVAAVGAMSSENLSDAERGAIYPHNTAYVIFTSGPTGDAKAGASEHARPANYLAVSAGTFSAVTGTAILHSSISLAFTITALFTPLTVGGRVQIASLDIDPAEPQADAAAGPCTFLKVTPSHLPLVFELS